MTIRNLLIFVALIFALTKEVNSACVCNEKGTDGVCGKKECTEVRPKHKYNKNPKICLPPVGDSCWCKQTWVKPALLPKPCMDYQNSEPSCECKKSKTYPNTPSMPPAPSYPVYPTPQVHYVPAAPPTDDSPPADPISISLAIQAGKAIKVPEAKLAYGFVQKPIDGQPKVYRSSVKEENLYALKKDVITWKKPNPVYRHLEEEDYQEPEEEEMESSVDEGQDTASLTYKQLGYVVEKFKNPQFQAVMPDYAPSYTPTYTPSKPGKSPTDCGYRPGRIAKYKPNKNQYPGEYIQRY